jgi:hypothetical protein
MGGVVVVVLMASVHPPHSRQTELAVMLLSEAVLHHP